VVSTSSKLVSVQSIFCLCLLSLSTLGDATNGCLSSGSHYNPLEKNHGAPSDTDRHVGDLGNIESDKYGEATINLSDDLISLNGVRSIIG
jgi:superoxide dismutase, Cu-Zn family